MISLLEPIDIYSNGTIINVTRQNFGLKNFQTSNKVMKIKFKISRCRKFIHEEIFVKSIRKGQVLMKNIIQGYSDSLSLKYGIRYVIIWFYDAIDSNLVKLNRLSIHA